MNNKYGMLGVVVSVVALLVAGTVIPNAYAAQLQLDSIAYKDVDEFMKNLKVGLMKAGFDDKEIASIEPMIEKWKGEISKYNHFIYGVKKGSLYLFGCLLPQEPPLNLGQDIQCLVLYMSMGTPDRANDLHVYINAPYNYFLLDIPSPNLTDPFLWISDPITLDQVGTWNIVANFTRDGAIILTLDVTFQVIPESIIGVAGIVAGPLAVLAYKLRKKSNQ